MNPIRSFYNLTVSDNPDSPIATTKFASCEWYQRKDWLEVVSDRAYGLYVASVDAAVKVCPRNRHRPVD